MIYVGKIQDLSDLANANAFFVSVVILSFFERKPTRDVNALQLEYMEPYFIQHLV